MDEAYSAETHQIATQDQCSLYPMFHLKQSSRLLPVRQT